METTALPEPAGIVQTVPASSDPGFLVLHALRLKGFAETPVVAALTRLPEADAGDHLAKAAAGGLVTRRDGRISGWALTTEGRLAHAQSIAQELDGAGARDAVKDAYGRFHDINNELLTVCTDWQLRNGALNDHADPAYDADVIGRLQTVDTKVQPICADLAGALGRFAEYGTRFTTALARVQSGERDWFAKPMIDSYHTVWFELHEDLLATLGIERSKEGSQ